MLNKFFFQLATPVSPIRGVADSLTQRYGDSATLRINDTRSQRLPDSTIRGVGDSPSTICGVDDSPYHRYSKFSFKKFNSRLSVSVMRGAVDSAYQWCGESSTPRIGKSLTPRIVDTESHRLPVSLSWGVVFRIRISPRIRSPKPKLERLEM